MYFNYSHKAHKNNVKPTLLYYAFGSAIQELSYSSDTDNLYRFGFNGMEKENESFSDAYDFGARIYDGRLGRWLALDPLMNKYPDISPYHFSFNSPMIFKDIDGRSAKITINADGSAIISINLKLYGPATSKLNADMVNNLAANIQLMLNEAMTSYLANNGSKIKIGGKEVTNVAFMVDASIIGVNNDEGLNQQLLDNDLSNNYIEVAESSGSSYMKNRNEISTNPDGTKTAVSFGGNMGKFNLDEMYDKGTTTINQLISKEALDLCKQNQTICTQPEVSTTPLHEILHSLGLLSSADGGIINELGRFEGHLKPLMLSDIKKDADGIFDIMLGRQNGITSYNRRPTVGSITAMHLENVILTQNQDLSFTGYLGEKTIQQNSATPTETSPTSTSPTNTTPTNTTPVTKPK